MSGGSIFTLGKVQVEVEYSLYVANFYLLRVLVWKKFSKDEK
jgi:hypothetical protein